jgi:transcriptional regulator with XRE-family HTH domain
MISPSKQNSRQAIRSKTEDAVQPGPMVADFCALLKSWRTSRRFSQLDLAMEAKVSQRHLSFLESGRAQPSREMVLHLSNVLRIPLRERNYLLLAGGFAPQYQERPLESLDMAAVKQALEATLRHHEPYPALAVDRWWNVVLQNAAVDRLIALLGSPPSVWQRVDPTGRHNLMRLTLHPRGLQPLVRNWQETATVLITRLQSEVLSNPADAQLGALFSDLCALPGIPSDWSQATWALTLPPVLTIELGKQSEPSLKIFSMVCRFGTAMDVTADEMRLELIFPGDDYTAAFFNKTNHSVTLQRRAKKKNG